MPDPGPRVLYRLLDHIAGVNWRPTRFAQPVPNIRICGLCHMVPKKTITLPCAHFLCESCHRASIADGSGICPLDREAFAEDECIWNPFPDRKLKDIKAHCWNHPQGCEIVGTMDSVLRHFETECAFHTVECQQCGVAVLHNELVPHYLDGCRGGAPLLNTDRGDTVSMNYMRAAVEELKAFVRDPHQDELPAFQSQINQLMEQCRQDATATMRLLTESTDDLKGQLTRMASSMQEMQSLACSEEKPRAGSSEAGSCGEAIPFSAEKKLILRRVEVFAKHSLSVLEQLRQNVQQGRAPHIPLAIKPLDDTEYLSDPTYRTCREFQLRNANELLSSWNKFLSKVWAEQILWDRRDRLFKVAISTERCPRAELHLSVQLFCLLPSGWFSPCALNVTLLHKDSQKNRHMWPNPVPQAEHSRYSYFLFTMEIEPLKEGGFLADGELRFRLYTVQ